MKFKYVLKNIFANKENIKYSVYILIIITTILVVSIYSCINNKEGKIVINDAQVIQKIGKNKVGVYIDGEVNNPGYIEISKGKNLEYALSKIGGITKDADINNIDLKQILKNGEKIIVPKKREFSDVEDLEIDNEMDNVQDFMININEAGEEELKSLPGIGDVTAQRIIEYRNKKRFESIEDIQEVKGIGDRIYEKIKNNICV